jgi:zinc/manganese transport system permease protein
MSYFDRALLAIALSGALAGLAGTFIILRRRVLLVQALTHATFPGAVIAVLLGFTVQVGALAASGLILFFLILVGRLRPAILQATTGVILTAGFALGILLQAINPAVPLRLDAYLFGSVLASTWLDVVLLVVTLSGTILVLLVFGRRLEFFLFDRVGYQVSGMRPWLAELVLLSLTVATVVAIMPALGALLTISLVAAPAAAAKELTRTLRGMLVLAPLLAIASGLGGLFLSRWIGLAAGASVAVVACAVYVVAAVIARARRRTT